MAEREKYGDAALATCFLKFPHARLHDLLEEWQRHTQRATYEQQRATYVPREQHPQAMCSAPVSERRSSTDVALPSAVCSPPAIAPVFGTNSILQELQSLGIDVKEPCNEEAMQSNSLTCNEEEMRCDDTVVLPRIQDVLGQLHVYLWADSTLIVHLTWSCLNLS